FSAVVTAAALWSSVLPKIARGALALVVIFLWQVLPGSMALVFSGGRSGGVSFSSAIPGGNWPLALFDTALVLALCLIGAVRRLSPRAESQTALTRVLPLL